MTPENRKLLLAEIINTAQEAKNHIRPGEDRYALNRIIRLAKTLYVDAIKENIPPT